MAMLKKAIIQCPSDDVKNIGEVVGVIEVSEKGFGGIRAGKNQVIWDCSRYAVRPGDVWKDGIFYHDAGYSDPAEYVPSTEEQLAEVQAKVATAASYDEIAAAFAEGVNSIDD